MRKLLWLWLYALTLTALVTALFQSTSDETRVRRESFARLSTIAASLDENIVAQLESGRLDRIARTVERLRSRHGVQGLAICRLIPGGELGFPRGEGWEELCRSREAHRAIEGIQRTSESSWSIEQRGDLRLQLAHRLPDVPLLMILSQDASTLRSHWIASFVRTLALAWLIGLALISLVMAQVRRWLQLYLRHFHLRLRSLLSPRETRLREATERDASLSASLSEQISEDATVLPGLEPLAQDLDRLAAKILALPRRSPNREKPHGEGEDAWLSELKASMGSRRLVVIANREPYIHQRKDSGLEVIRPASGLVTALEPILRNFGGLWIGHGSGSGDREVVDAKNQLEVPPGNPKYTLRRVWLSPEEEKGYYYGFSNEGLWPLCHLAHTRPTFRLTDWHAYNEVNQKFCDAVPREELTSESLILVQDYHFALLPGMLKQRVSLLGDQRSGRPKIGLFWHIPWPNPEAFGICPWQSALLNGMLGADVIGFHTQYHCNNFLETCNRYLEARIDWEKFSVTMGDHETLVRAFPIGIDTAKVRTLTDEEIETTKARYGIRARRIAVGVDRLDYTKGLVERVEAVERFLEKNPTMIGEFSLVQMGSPSRSTLPAYQALATRLSEAVDRVNQRFGQPERGYLPVVFLPSHHEWDEIQYFYQLGDVCMVTSLHDGMNLVAKEYVWCQRADRGALILSQFTGASRELTEAFIVNPYSTEEMADALAAALSLTSEERARKMNAMKEKVRSQNAYQWASTLVKALVTRPGAAAPLPLRRDRPDRTPSKAGYSL